MIIYLTKDFVPTTKENAIMAKVFPKKGNPYFIEIIKKVRK